MKWHKTTLTLQTNGKGLYPFTNLVENQISKWEINEGMCFLYVQHTSASLLISESYDPTARLDLEAFMDRIAPESQPWHQHTLEGRDDSPSHMRAMLTHTSEAIPIESSGLCLGTWQGIYLFEHRARPHHRKILVKGLQID